MSTDLPGPDVNDCDALQAELLGTIPLAKAIELRVTQYSGNAVSLSAPLAPNENDKGCAFGGSLASLMTLAGWGLPWLWMREAELPADIYIQDSQIRYLAPLWGELNSHALSDQRAAFLSAFRSRGKARLSVEVETVDAQGVVVATLAARFVALPRRDVSKA